MYELPDLTNVTEEELDAKSIVAEIKDDETVFDPKTYEVQDGVMIFKRPLKTKLNYLNFATLDRMSIIKPFDTKYVYVFAISVDEEHNGNLVEIFEQYHGEEKGYQIYISWSKGEVDNF